jgi:hypothetical protein
MVSPFNPLYRMFGTEYVLHHFRATMISTFIAFDVTLWLFFIYYFLFFFQELGYTTLPSRKRSMDSTMLRGRVSI